MFIKKMLALLSVLGVFFSLLAGDGYADELPEGSQVIVLPVGVLHEGDFFAFGDSVEISGDVHGDVYLLANQMVIDGNVHGDVIAAGGSIDISGSVSGNIRVIGGQLLVSGVIGQNVTAVAGNVQLLLSSSVGNNVVITAGNVDLAAKIGGNATIIASNLRISSDIQKGVNAYVGQLRMTSRAYVGGNVDYQSSTLAWVDTGAVIKGEVIHHPSLVHELIQGTWIQGVLVGGKVLAIVMNFMYTLVVGIILIKMFPNNLKNALTVLNDGPWKAFTWGLMLLFLLPLAALILLMTILGVPFALTLIAANIIGLYTAKIYCVFWIANWIFVRFKFKPNRLPVLALGLFLYFILTSIPIIGVILSFIAMILGLGAGVISQSKRLSRQGWV